MLSKEENDRLARVGRGTPMGELLRRYWHPVGCSALVDGKPQRVKLLDEDLVLYRGESGKPVLMQLRCTHRNVALDYGRVEGDAIRCPYHGWLFSNTGACIAQPSDPDSDCSRSQFALRSYKTEEVSGIIFAYMGPDPAPVLPIYDLLRSSNGFKQLRVYNVGSNWLQDAENILDATHFSWLHGYAFPQFGGKRTGAKIQPMSYGLVMSLALEGGAEESTAYIAPAINRFAVPIPGSEEGLMNVIIYRVPIDDYSHMNYMLAFIKNSQIPEDPARPVPTERLETKIGEYLPAEGDWWGIDVTDQDRMALEQQDAISDRTQEHLLASDVGVVSLRRLLREALEAVARGEDPIHVIRDPAEQNVELKFKVGGAPPVDSDFSESLFPDRHKAEPASAGVD